MADEAEKFVAQCKILHEGLYQRMDQIAEYAAERAIKRTLLIVGIDAEDPLSIQAQFATLREIGEMARDAEFRKDLESIRSWRLTLGSIRAKSITAIVGALIVASLAAFWSGIVQAIHK